MGWLGDLAGPVRVAYEAGPTGFGLARAFEAAGIGCLVAAPSLIARSPAGAAERAMPQTPSSWRAFCAGASSPR